MCGYTCIRFLVLFFNIIFFIAGAGLIGTGAYLRLEDDDYLDLCDKYSWATGANLLLAVGVIILVIAFFGCFGAWKESSLLLGIFFVFLLIIFFLEIAAGIYGAVEKGKIDDELQGCLNGTFIDNINGNDKVAETWHKFEKKFKCCGINGKSDYMNAGINSTIAACIGMDYGSKGCYDKIKTDLEDNLGVVLGVGIGFAMIQILGMIMSMWLICQIKKGGETA